MRGEVLRYDDAGGTGLISGDDGTRYSFSRADLQQLRPIRAGDRVDFVPGDNSIATEIVLLGDAGPGQTYTGEDLSTWGYFKKCMRLYVEGNGRARRKEYWSFVLWELIFLIPPLIIAFMIAGASGGSSYGGYDYDGVSATSAGLLGVVMIGSLVFVIPGITVTIRRLHDVGLSGWLVLLGLVPYVGGLFLFIVSLIPSQARDNEHGPIPKKA